MNSLVIKNDNIVDEQFNNYGIFRVPTNKRVLESIFRCAKPDYLQVRAEHYFLNLLEIQGEYIYSKSSYPLQLMEFNETFKLLSPDKARWRFREIEYKINILNDPERLFLLFDELAMKGFDLSNSPQLFKSKEALFYLCDDQYFSILTWAGEGMPNAIKFKETFCETPILTRDTEIIDYSESALTDILKRFNISGAYEEHLIAFEKKKKRHIAIDKQRGYVFGVSFNISQTEHRETFSQVEIEYWSKIEKRNGESTFNENERLASHHQAIEGIKSYLTANGFHYDERQLTKTKWLQNLQATEK